MPNENENQNLVDETVDKIISFENLQDAFTRYNTAIESAFSNAGAKILKLTQAYVTYPGIPAESWGIPNMSKIYQDELLPTGTPAVLLTPNKYTADPNAGYTPSGSWYDTWIFNGSDLTPACVLDGKTVKKDGNKITINTVEKQTIVELMSNGGIVFTDPSNQNSEWAQIQRRGQRSIVIAPSNTWLSNQFYNKTMQNVFAGNGIRKVSSQHAGETITMLEINWDMMNNKLAYNHIQETISHPISFTLTNLSGTDWSLSDAQLYFDHLTEIFNIEWDPSMSIGYFEYIPGLEFTSADENLTIVNGEYETEEDQTCFYKYENNEYILQFSTNEWIHGVINGETYSSVDEFNFTIKADQDLNVTSATVSMPVVNSHYLNAGIELFQHESSGSPITTELDVFRAKSNVEDVTAENHGLMTSADKAKLDALPTTVFSGDYNDLSNKPNLATVATTGDYDDLNNSPFERESVSIPGIYDYTLTSADDDGNGVWNKTINDNSFINRIMNGLDEAFPNLDWNEENVDPSVFNIVFKVNDLNTVNTASFTARKEEYPEDGEVNYRIFCKTPGGNPAVIVSAGVNNGNLWCEIVCHPDICQYIFDTSNPVTVQKVEFIMGDVGNKFTVKPNTKIDGIDYDYLINKPEIVVVSGSKECNRLNNASGEYSFLIDVPDDFSPYDYTVISIMQQIGGWVAADGDAWTMRQEPNSSNLSTPSIDWMYNETQDKWTIQLNIDNNSSQAVTLKYRVVFMKVS